MAYDLPNFADLPRMYQLGDSIIIPDDVFSDMQSQKIASSIRFSV